MRENRPLENSATAPWGRKITHSDYTKMLGGFMPEMMEQRWMAEADTPDAQGNTIVQFLRSWTSRQMCLLTIEAGDSNKTEDKNWATIVDISWDKSGWGRCWGPDTTEEEAKRSALLFCRQLMNCELED
jgi:hypothetical protein